VPHAHAIRNDEKESNSFLQTISRHAYVFFFLAPTHSDDEKMAKSCCPLRKTLFVPTNDRNNRLLGQCWLADQRQCLSPEVLHLQFRFFSPLFSKSVLSRDVCGPFSMVLHLQFLFFSHFFRNPFYLVMFVVRFQWCFICSSLLSPLFRILLSRDGCGPFQ
jgi:hypothetical protein